MGCQETTRQIAVPTSQHAQMLNITSEVAGAIPNGFTGMCFVFCQHTTAGLTINENADPDVVHDMLLELDRLVPWRNPASQHSEGNSAAHVKATLVGSSVAVPVTDGRMDLGVWQGIYFCEFDGPRRRRVLVRLVGSGE
jgi:secondary thiamine-phosphate synthase enzyme